MDKSSLDLDRSGLEGEIAVFTIAISTLISGFPYDNLPEIDQLLS